MSYLRYRTVTLIGIFLIIYGWITVLFRSSLLIYSIVAIGWIICIFSIIDLLIQAKNLPKKSYLIGTLLLGMIMIHFPAIDLKFLVYCFGLFCIIDFFMKMITFFQYHQNHVKYQWFLFLDATFYLLIGIAILIRIDWIMPKLTLYLGVYLILFGLRLVRDGIEELFGNFHAKSIRRRGRISIPVVWTSLIPKAALIGIERRIHNHEVMDEYKSNETPDIEVMIHTAPSGHNMLGHVDLCIGDTFITYGNYDFTTYRLFDSIGDGVIVIAPKEKYIEFSESYLTKTLVGFGIKLTPEQKDRVDHKIQSILENTVPWQPRAARDPEHAKDYKEYSSMLYKATHARFYKVKAGRFKSFFILGTNCGLFVDSILGVAGSDLLNVNGMISPGTYYDYLNNEFYKKDSIVISKRIYYMPEAERAKHEVHQKGGVK